MGKQRNPNGTGSYKKRKDGRYEWKQQRDGKKRSIYARSPSILHEKVKPIAELPITNANKLTVDNWFNDTWLEIYVKPLKSGQTYEWTKDLYQNASPIIGHRKLPGLKPSDIQSVIAKMNTAIVKPAKIDTEGNIIKPAQIGYSTKTMKETIGVLRRGFRQAVKDGKIAANPVPDAKDIEIPKKQKKTQKVLSVHELHDLYDSMTNSRWIWAMKFLLVTGLRRGELLALKETDIEIDYHRISIDESGNSSGIGDTKNRKVHYVPLSKKAMEYLIEQHKMLEKERNPILYNEKLKKTGLIFPSENGTMPRPDSFTKMVKRFAEKAEIYASPHCLRHTFVFMNRKTLSLKDLQYILGHDESTTTLDIYGDMFDDSSEETAGMIDSVFDKMEEKLKSIDEEKNKPKGKIIEFRKKA